MQIDFSDTKVQIGIIVVIAIAVAGFIYFNRKTSPTTTPTTTPPYTTKPPTTPPATKPPTTPPTTKPPTTPPATKPPTTPPNTTTPNTTKPNITPPIYSTTLSIPSSDIKSCDTDNTTVKCGPNCDVICDPGNYCYNNNCIVSPSVPSDFVRTECNITSASPQKVGNSNLYGKYTHTFNNKTRYFTFYPQTNTFVYEYSGNTSCGKYILNETTNVGEMIFTGGVLSTVYTGKLNFRYDPVNDKIYNLLNVGSSGTYSR